MDDTSSKKMIGQQLIEQGVISSDQLQIALQEQIKIKKPVGQILVTLGFISESTMRDAIGASLGQKSVALEHTVIDPSARDLVPRALATRHNLLPLGYDAEKRKLTVAIADPNDIVAIDKLRALFEYEIEIEVLLAAQSEINHAIDQNYGYELSIEGLLHEIETGEIDYRTLAATQNEYSQPVVRLIDALLTDAVKHDASDIHFEPEERFLRIRYRIDGILRQIRSLHKSYWPAMAVRIKVISGMNIAEMRAPQDGRISLNIRGRAVDFRVAVQPTIHGENVVLRILDRQKGIVPLDELGLTEDHLRLLKLMIARPEGILLVTGPTGSGKTTTLYSVLNHLNQVGVNIMTLEDPVEYPMAMVRQTSVAEASRLDFANGIRSMMRQDPDVILVGEIRDSETAEMAFRAAMTGHQVFSTLHTNSALGAIPRLLDVGIVPDILSGNIIGIVAQRLVRRLCKNCRELVAAEPHECMLLGLDECATPHMIYRHVGCPACDGSGFRGRLSIMEVLRVDRVIDELIAQRAPLREMRDHALSRGFRSLADDGIRRVLDGSTSLEEVARVVDFTEHALQ